MHLYGDFDEILEENLIKELEWLKEEFELFFEPKKGNFSKMDLNLAKKIIENFMDCINLIDNPRILELVSDTLNELDLKFPKLLNK